MVGDSYFKTNSQQIEHLQLIIYLERDTWSRKHEQLEIRPLFIQFLYYLFTLGSLGNKDCYIP